MSAMPSDKSPSRSGPSSDRGPLDTVRYSVWILYNFTRTDIKTIVIPQAFFGIATALSGYPVAAAPSGASSQVRGRADHVLAGSSEGEGPSTLALSSRIFSNAPLVIVWLWLNLLIFTLANQRLPSSIVEDAHNKPWRNIPSDAVSPGSARRILVAALCLSWAVSAWWGVWFEFAGLAVLIWIYNDLGGAEEHYMIRNFLNAGGYVFYGLGALKLALSGSINAATSSSSPSSLLPSSLLSASSSSSSSSSAAATTLLNKTAATTFSSPFASLPSSSSSSAPPSVLGPAAVPWALLAGLAVATTIQVQDLQDQIGDRARSRRTLPLVLGDRFCRWTVALAVLFWSGLCPAFWATGPLGYVMTVASGSLVAGRVLWLGYCGLEEGEERARKDEGTFLAWCLWLALIYLLPLVRAWEVERVERGFQQVCEGDIL